MSKERLDVLLVKRGLEVSRERAKACIMAGRVFVNGQKVDKAGTMLNLDADIRVQSSGTGYVSRGGLKLAKALAYFNIDIAGKIVVDIGASTGGFTDCALKNGASKVFAIDVGYGQLAWSLRTDNRVINMERTNIRDVTPAMLGEQPDFVTIDVAFISLDKVLPVVKTILKPAGTGVALIKPQFEAGREKVGKKGVVKEPAVHHEVIVRVINLARDLGFTPLGITFSPVKGPEGNIEYLLYLINGACDEGVTEAAAVQVVREAHACLNG